MKMKEGNLLSRTGNLKECEDAVVMTDDFACVIDGTTSKSDRLWDGKKSGLLASQILSEAVTQLPKECDHRCAVDMLTSAISSYYSSKGVYEEICSKPM